MPNFDEIVERELVDSRFAKSGLITWEQAERVINEWFKEWWSDFETKMELSKTYRSWQVRRTAHRVFLKCFSLAHIELVANLYPQKRKRRGLQKVQTRNWRPTEFRAGVEFGMFNGKPAWKRRPGRPALSATEVLRREAERIQKRRAQNKTEVVHKDRKPLPTEPPPTQLPRPSTGEQFGKRAKAEPPKAKTIAWDEIVEILSNGVRDEIIKAITEVAKDYGEEKGKQFIEHMRSVFDGSYDATKFGLDFETDGSIIY